MPSSLSVGLNEILFKNEYRYGLRLNETLSEQKTIAYGLHIDYIQTVVWSKWSLS